MGGLVFVKEGEDGLSVFHSDGGALDLLSLALEERLQVAVPSRSINCQYGDTRASIDFEVQLVLTRRPRGIIVELVFDSI